MQERVINYAIKIYQSRISMLTSYHYKIPTPSEIKKKCEKIIFSFIKRQNMCNRSPW